MGLIAPGGYLEERLIEKAVRNLETLGFRVKTGPHLRAMYGGYGGTVEQRVADLHGMFRDREVAALWAVRGGSGCIQVLPHLDYALIARNPKALIGYSDITALHLAILRQAGLVTFHAPVAGYNLTDYAIANLRAVLMEPQPRTTFEIAPEVLRRAEAEPQYAPRTIRAGVAEGRLVGGNLSVLCAMVGTPHLPATRKALLFLEDVGEAPYRIDRMLTQLQQSGVLTGAAAVMFGLCTKCVPPDDEPSLTLAETIDNQLSSLKVPAVYGYSFGHMPFQYTLPVGVRARLDTQARTLTLLEPAVI